MKNIGIVRKIDELGRVVIPMEIRHSLNIHEKDSLSISVNAGSIILTKKEDACVFCGKKEKLTMFENKFICENCKEKISSIE